MMMRLMSGCVELHMYDIRYFDAMTSFRSLSRSCYVVSTSSATAFHPSSVSSSFSRRHFLRGSAGCLAACLLHDERSIKQSSGETGQRASHINSGSEDGSFLSWAGRLSHWQSTRSVPKKNHSSYLTPSENNETWSQHCCMLRRPRLWFKSTWFKTLIQQGERP